MMEAVILLCAAILSHKATGPTHQTLAIIQDDYIRVTHSQFFESLQNRNHNITFTTAYSNDNIVLHEFGNYFFDNLILFAPAVEAFGGIDLDTIIKFVDDGHNIFIAGDVDVSDTIRNVAGECGVEYDTADTQVIDHFHYADMAVAKKVKMRMGDHTLVTSREVASIPILVGEITKPILFRGIGMAVDPDNVLVLKTLSGTNTTYSANPSESVGSYPQSIGSDTVLVASVQMRNNARATFTGSISMLSNEFFEVVEHSNRDFADSVAAWTFCERGVLSVANVQHWKVGSGPDSSSTGKSGVYPRSDLPPTLFLEPEIARNNKIYRIRDRIMYSVGIRELTTGGWVAFQANDVQIEVVMLDPYIRLTLIPDIHGNFTAELQVPDVHGVYQLRLVYRRPGVTTLRVIEHISVRPLRHDEFERFLPAAYPYYASVLSTMFGLFIFCFYYLYMLPSSGVKAA